MWLAGLLLAGALGAGASSSPAGPAFPPEEIRAWQPHAFRGYTDYRLAESGGETAVRARCDGASASGLFYRGEIDLERTPVVEWRWRVDAGFVDNDERTRDGDDYPARLYFVDERPVARWRTRALNYVWASHEPRGADWPNAYTAAARMIAVRSGADMGAWHTERRNLREDFRRYHGRDLSRLSAVAIMTDCDNTGQAVEAWYGEIRFLPE